MEYQLPDELIQYTVDYIKSGTSVFHLHKHDYPVTSQPLHDGYMRSFFPFL
jgi:hypothetical protein